MPKDVPTIDETVEGTDTETTDQELSLEEQVDDTHTSPDENGGTVDETEPQVPTSEPDVLPPDTDVLASLHQHLTELHELFNNQIARNQNQKQMFDTIYREMKDYKENSLMEAFHKPIIHSLIQFYDNFRDVESQLNEISETTETFGELFDEVVGKQTRKTLTNELPKVWIELKARLSDFRNNMENVRIELEEVLYRIDVEPYAEHLNKLDRKLHKTIKTIPTDDREQHQNVVAVHKIGFYWHEKVFRPEEVTILRYTPHTDEETVGENPTNEKGDETDG